MNIASGVYDGHPAKIAAGSGVLIDNAPHPIVQDRNSSMAFVCLLWDDFGMNW